MDDSSIPNYHEKAMDKLVDLIINQVHVAFNFLKYFLTLQVGLVAVLGYVLKESDNLKDVIHYFEFGIPVFGAITTWLLAKMVLYERRFQSLYVIYFNKLNDSIHNSFSQIPKIFPDGPYANDLDENVKEDKENMSVLIKIFSVFIGAAWIATSCFLSSWSSSGTIKTIFFCPLEHKWDIFIGVFWLLFISAFMRIYWTQINTTIGLFKEKKNDNVIKPER